MQVGKIFFRQMRHQNPSIAGLHEDFGNENWRKKIKHSCVFYLCLITKQKSNPQMLVNKRIFVKTFFDGKHKNCQRS